MRMAWPGTGTGAETIPDRYVLGRWQRAQDDGANRLRLGDADSPPRQFRIVDADTLRMLDIRGRDIESSLNYNLKRLPQVDTIAGPQPLRGLYSYMADAAILQECHTGKRYPLLLTGDHETLERAYLRARSTPGALTLALFEGHFVEQSPEPGRPPRTHIVVDRFGELRPGETCAAQAPAQASLTNTYWRPVELGGKPVEIHAGTREPYLVLEAKNNRVRGYSGCNGFGGVFERTGDSLHFKGIVATMMACLPTGDLEKRFFAALNATAAHHITGDALELRDQDGKVRARFEARYLR